MYLAEGEVAGLGFRFPKAKRLLKGVLIYTNPIMYVGGKAILRSKAGRKITTVVAPIVGSVLSPFTLGLSAVAAGVIVAGIKMKEAKDAARKAKMEQGELLKEEARLQEKQTNQQADELYNAAPETFQAGAGISPEAWMKLKVEEKVAIIEKINKGQMKVGEGLAFIGDVSPTVLLAVGGAALVLLLVLKRK